MIDHLTVAVPEGQRLAIVGPSGGGKTTIARLIAGIHAPDGGTVHGPDHHGRSVTLVTQDVHVFSGTIADDLRLARSDATTAELHEALRSIGASDWVARLPHGIDTVVGSGGHALTATEAQQLALARLALTDSPVVVLDEATAEAGSSGARRLEAAADAAIRDRTAIVIAHRLTQAAAADRIVVVDHGHIVQDGTHHELSTSVGPYADLWRAWTVTQPPPPSP